MAQVSVAWALSKEGVYSAARFVDIPNSYSSEGVSAPIVGTTSLTNLADIIGKLTATKQSQSQR